MKNVSIDKEGIEIHINRYFKSKGKMYTYSDVVRLKNMRFGKKKLSIGMQVNALEIGSSHTLYRWHKAIDQL